MIFIFLVLGNFALFLFFLFGIRQICMFSRKHKRGLIRLVSLCHFWRELTGGDDYHPVSGVKIRAAANERGGIDIPIESLWMVR